MAEAIYKVGDILEIEKMYGILPSSDKIRCLVLKCIHPGYEFIVYSLLIYKSDESFTVMGLNQKELFRSARKVGHIDISSFLGDEESTEPDHATFFTAATLAQAADLRNENEKLKAENKRLLEALSESESKAHSRLDRITLLLHKVDELEDEVENVKDKLTADNARYLQSMTCSEKQMTEAAKRIHEAMEHLNTALCNN